MRGISEDISYQWLENVLEEFGKYDFFDCTLQDIKEFYDAKKEFLISPNKDAKYMMKF